MRLNSRNLILALAVGAFGFTASSGWASMAQTQTPNPNQPAQTTPGTQTTHPYAQQKNNPYAQNKGTKVQSVSGTVTKSGESYVLRASNGQQYNLTDASNAKKFVGKQVQVTGKVNPSSHSIEVQSIQPQ